MGDGAQVTTAVSKVAGRIPRCNLSIDGGGWQQREQEQWERAGNNIVPIERETTKASSCGEHGHVSTSKRVPKRGDSVFLERARGRERRGEEGCQGEEMSRERKRTCGEGEMWGAVREEGGRRGGPSGEEELQVGGACGDQDTGRGERGGSGGGRRRGRGGG
jgi:hypothetical protein